MLSEHGLPLPVTNKLAGERRIDCRWPGHALTVELDSYRFHSSRFSWELDREREREARRRGDEFRRFTYEDVFVDFGYMLERLRPSAELAAGGARTAAGGHADGTWARRSRPGSARPTAPVPTASARIAGGHRASPSAPTGPEARSAPVDRVRRRGGPRPRIASYRPIPSEVGRVLLLYSGGLDTSVMLKWIQDEYEAEVVALTVNLGQPGEDYDVVQGQGLRARRPRVHGGRRARGVRPRVVAAGDQGQRALRRRLPAVHRARPAADREARGRDAREPGCDTIAHGCTGKGNDQVRIEATVATLAPEMKIIAPVRSWQMGREEEIEYARKNGIPVKGGTEAPPYSIDDNLGAARSEGGPIEDLDEPPHDDVFELVTRPRTRPTSPSNGGRVREGRARSRSTASDSAWWSCSSARPRSAAGTASGIVDHIEDRIVGLKVRDLYEVPAAVILLPRTGAREARRHDPPEQLQACARPAVGVPRVRRAVA